MSLVFFDAVPFLARFLDYLLLWGNHLCQESSKALRTTWSGTSCSGQGGFLTLFATFPFEVLIGLLKALEELDRLNISTVGFLLVARPDVQVRGTD